MSGATRAIAVLVLAWAAASSPRAAGATDTVLIDAELRLERVTLRQVGREGVVYIDELGLERWADTRSVLALVREDAAPLERPALGLGVVELTDGQRASGRLASGEGHAEVLAWEHDLLGRVLIPLERVRRVVMPASDPAVDPEHGTEDSILLRHGDVMRGFVTAIGPRTLIEVDGTEVAVGADRLHSVRLANPAAQPEGVLVYLASGEVLSATGLGEGEPGRLGFSPALSATQGEQSPPARVSLRDVEALVLDASRVRALADLPTAGREGLSGGRAISPDARSARGFAPAVVFTGPGSVSWVLPEGATRFACTVRLPESEWAWGDCVVRTIIDAGHGEVEMLDARLSGAQPVAEWITDLPEPGLRGRVLTIVVEPGEHGPIQDRPVVERALLVLSK